MPGPILLNEEFPIYCVTGRYLLYDVNVISHVRATYQMCGCLSGTLPQIPQQNIFLGLPLELMTEEASLLVENHAAYIVDDVDAHKAGLQCMESTDKASFLVARKLECLYDSLVHQQEANGDREARFRIEYDKVKDFEQFKFIESVFSGESGTTVSPSELLKKQKIPPKSPLTFYPVASMSHTTFHRATPSHTNTIPSPNANSYPLYKYLQKAGYYVSPGLRFGCQFMAYPGDPLRFHSHFLVQGVGWNEEVDVVDVVGGGRLGTGVKKAWMIGGEDRAGNMKIFCVEWGGF